MSIEDTRKLFVAGLADSVTEDALRQIFEAVDVEVENVSIPVDRETGRSRGFGFVTLGSADDADRARKQLDRSVQGGREMSVRMFHAEPPGRRDGPGRGGDRDTRSDGDRTVYVGNLPYDCTEQEIRELIGDLGQIDRIALPLNPNGQARGFGFVTLRSEQDAHSVLAGLAGVSLRGRRLVLNQARGRSGARTERSSRRVEMAPGKSAEGSSRLSGEPLATGPTDVPRQTFDARRRGAGRSIHEERDKGRRGGRRGKHRERRPNQRRNDYFDDDE